MVEKALAKRSEAPLAKALSVLVFVSLAVFWAFQGQRPPASVPATAPPHEFSSARAMAHVNAIAGSRPIGSARHTEALNYIVGELAALGFEPEVQKTTVVRATGNGFSAATVSNVIAVIKGTGSTGSILLTGHYDSVPTGPGAGDDGSAVGVIMETARALKAETALQNDLVLLLTDGEEVGLLGAKAFVDDHPLFKDVRLVLNYEARGSNGQALMFETSDPNAWMISEFARAVPYPAANSLSYEIYKRLPNDTDLTVFKRAGVAGMNFAFIDDSFRYHTQLDNVANIDEGSVQHQGSYALSLARHFGRLDLKAAGGNSAVYFNGPGSTFVHYSNSMILPLIILAALVLAGAVLIGLRKGRMTLPGIAMGFLGMLASLIVTALFVMLVRWLVDLLQPASQEFFSSAYYSKVYIAAYSSLAVAALALIRITLLKRVAAENLMAGALLWWGILMVASYFLAPGGSYLFTWPLLFSALGLGAVLIFVPGDLESAKPLATLSLFAIPAIVLVGQVIYQVSVALAMQSIIYVAVMITLLLGLLTPQMSAATKPYRWLLAGVAMVFGLGALVWAALPVRFDKDHPKQNNIFYALNADTGRAVWASYDGEPDEWTSQFFRAERESNRLSEFIPSAFDAPLKSHAPVADLAPPDAAILEDKTVDGVRNIRLKISSPRQAPVISVRLDPATKVLNATINGKRVDNNSGAPSPPGEGWGGIYRAASDDTLELSLQLQPSQPVKLIVTDRSFGLPQLPDSQISPRPDYMIAFPSALSDSISVSKSFNF